MKKLCLLGLVATLASHAVFAETKPAALKDKNAFVSDLMKQMTLDEKIGQLRLISIGPEMPREMIRKEIAAGTYETPEKLEEALEHLMERLERE